MLKQIHQLKNIKVFLNPIKKTNLVVNGSLLAVHIIKMVIFTRVVTSLLRNTL